MTPPRLLLWTDAAQPYEAAIAEAGLADRVRIAALPRKESPSPDLLAETEALLGWGAPPACCRACRSCAGSSR